MVQPLKESTCDDDVKDIKFLVFFDDRERDSGEVMLWFKLEMRGAIVITSAFPAGETYRNFNTLDSLLCTVTN